MTRVLHCAAKMQMIHARHGESSDGHGFFLRVASLLSVDSVSSW